MKMSCEHCTIVQIKVDFNQNNLQTCLSKNKGHVLKIFSCFHCIFLLATISCEALVSHFFPIKFHNVSLSTLVISILFTCYFCVCYSLCIIYSCMLLALDFGSKIIQDLPCMHVQSKLI